MENKISFRINGVERTAEVDPEMKVIDLIRDVLGLTGTTRGCDNSTCGACTIILNGKAVKSCGLPALKADGADIVTIEGLANGTTLHPVQKALAESGAIQCGFCTPGIVMELAALFDEKPEATETEILNALNKHLCRCTGYEAIRDGALVAQKLVAQGGAKTN